jgi:cytochrome c5
VSAYATPLLTIRRDRGNAVCRAVTKFSAALLTALGLCASGFAAPASAPPSAPAATPSSPPAPAGVDAGRSGAQVYAAVCAACHDSGVLNAPRFGDRNAWKPLLAEGQRSLTRTAIRGIRKMPARGGDTSLSDREVARAVVHMANAAGGRFIEPR